MHDELTRQDLKLMQEELEHRRSVLRPKLLEDVKTARAFGDLSENFEYKAAKREKNRNESRIRFLENMIKTAVVIGDNAGADQVGLYFKGQKFNLFLGREFQNVSHFDALLTKSFTGLKPCIVPDKYLFNGPGDIGVCTPKVTLWSNLLTWSASGILSKTQFLEESERMLYNNPSDLAFFWNGSKPALCNISLGSSDSEPP